MPFTNLGKPAGQAVTRHKRIEFTEVPNRPCRPKPLPKRADGSRWPAGIAAKWRAWSAMPHTRLWNKTDWEFAVNTLEVAALWYETGNVNYIREQRIRERVMGTTFDARMMLRIRYVEPDTKEAKPVARLDDYRAL